MSFPGDDGSERLLKGNVTVRRLAECRSLDTRLVRGLDPRTHLCAGGDGVNPTDACNVSAPAPPASLCCLRLVVHLHAFSPPG